MKYPQIFFMKGIHLVVLLSMVGMGCSATHNEQADTFRITTTTGIIADAIRQIVRDSAEVQSLMGPGVDPHLYKASQGDLALLTGADVVIFNGLHLEGKMTDVLAKLGRTRPVIAMSDGIARGRVQASTQYENAPDPHIWFDVSLWREAVAYASRRLQQIDTAHAAFYQKNTQQYLAQLDSLHQAVREAMAKIPEQQRVLITAHDAFGYFGQAYAVEVRGLQGISTMSDYGLRDITNLVDYIVKHNIKAVFVESSVPPRAINAVVEGCRSRGHNVQIGGTLYSDAMGASGTPEGTYIGMVHHNVSQIVNALQ